MTKTIEDLIAEVPPNKNDPVKFWSVREAHRYIEGKLQESYELSPFSSASGKVMVEAEDYLVLLSKLTVANETLKRVHALNSGEGGGYYGSNEVSLVLECIKEVNDDH